MKDDKLLQTGATGGVPLLVTDTVPSLLRQFALSLSGRM